VPGVRRLVAVDLVDHEAHRIGRILANVEDERAVLARRAWRSISSASTATRSGLARNSTMNT
jgi:hypothetical protein